MADMKAKYLGGLRVECTHIASGTTIITDAPVDNHGKGEAFSPTDLCSTALATCCMTIMEAKENRGRYLPQLEKYLDRRINQPSWTMPDLGIAKARGVDLQSARQIRDLAEVYWILGEKLSPETRKAIRDGLRKWCFNYMLRACSARKVSEIGGFNWLRATTNWNPFCWIGVLHAADVFLVDSTNFQKYKSGKSFKYYGGHYTKTPVHISVNGSGRWYLVVRGGGQYKYRFY